MLRCGRLGKSKSLVHQLLRIYGGNTYNDGRKLGLNRWIWIRNNLGAEVFWEQ